MRNAPHKHFSIPIVLKSDFMTPLLCSDPGDFRTHSRQLFFLNHNYGSVMNRYGKRSLANGEYGKSSVIFVASCCKDTYCDSKSAWSCAFKTLRKHHWFVSVSGF